MHSLSTGRGNFNTRAYRECAARREIFSSGANALFGPEYQRRPYLDAWLTDRIKYEVSGGSRYQTGGVFMLNTKFLFHDNECVERGSR